MLVTLNYADLQKHNVTEIEVDQVMSSDANIECDLPSSQQGHDRLMLIGFTLSGRLLELGIEFLPDALHIFHASDATKQYQTEFARRIKP